VYLAYAIPDSPRFLYSKRKYDELKVALNFIAKMNKVNDETLVDNMI
jgi:hypothetical protein